MMSRSYAASREIRRTISAGLFDRAGTVAGMLDRCEVEAGEALVSHRHVMRGGRGRRVQPALVHRIGDELTDIGLHPIADIQEYSAILRDGSIGGEQMLECRIADVKAMASLAHLRELRRIAEQYDVASAERERQRIGERDLSRLIDEEIVELPLEFFAREEPCRAAGELVAFVRRRLRSNRPIRSCHAKLRAILGAVVRRLVLVPAAKARGPAPACTLRLLQQVVDRCMTRAGDRDALAGRQQVADHSRAVRCSSRCPAVLE